MMTIDDRHRAHTGDRVDSGKADLHAIEDGEPR